MDLTFVKEGDVVVLQLRNKEVYFAKVDSGIPRYTTIEGLKLNPSTIVEEFPDLKGKPIIEIKKEAVKRFREHIRNMNTYQEIRDYLQKDLERHGYKLILIHRKGFRPERPR